MNRREFLGGLAAAVAAAAFRSVKAADGKSEIHAMLLHPGRLGREWPSVETTTTSR